MRELELHEISFTNHHVVAPRFVESPLLVVTKEDWSRVRSPGRARRRMRQGHRQNLRVRKMPDPNVYEIHGVFYAHPATLRRLERELVGRLDRQIESALYGALVGR